MTKLQIKALIRSAYFKKAETNVALALKKAAS
jgi:hypothetical protein